MGTAVEDTGSTALAETAGGGLALPAAHPTATIYLDESGVIKRDRFFGIGCLRAPNGAELTRALRRHRQVLDRMEGELHWSAFDKGGREGRPSIALAEAAIDAFFELEGVSFCCTLADRQEGDLVKSHGSGWLAYEMLAGRALDTAIGETEVVTVLADHADTPKGIHFEEDVRDRVNVTRGRLAITTVTRIHSHASDGLQLTDLLLGAAMFDFRQGAKSEAPGDSQKAALSRYLLDRCGIVSFRPRGKAVAEKINVQLQQRRRTRRGRRGGDPT